MFLSVFAIRLQSIAGVTTIDLELLCCPFPELHKHRLLALLRNCAAFLFPITTPSPANLASIQESKTLLTDDQSQPRIREEAEAVEQVLAGVRRGRGSVELLSSEALEDEVRRNPSHDRRREAQATLALAVTSIEIDGLIAHRAQILVRLGYSPFDALHLAAAESGGADLLLTTDDRLLKRHALELLPCELGPDGLARFLRLNRSGTGDYTRDREQWRKDLTLDQILESIQKHRPR